eukprot:2336999-Pleurochrysis_carterae.AAC.1
MRYSFHHSCPHDSAATGISHIAGDDVVADAVAHAARQPRRRGRLHDAGCACAAVSTHAQYPSDAAGGLPRGARARSC